MGNTAPLIEVLHSLSLYLSVWEQSQESYEQFMIKQTEAPEPKMALSTLLFTYRGLLWLPWPIPHYGCLKMESEVQELYLCMCMCETTAAWVSRYAGDLWMSFVELGRCKRTTKYWRLVKRSWTCMLRRKGCACQRNLSPEHDKKREEKGAKGRQQIETRRYWLQTY